MKASLRAIFWNDWPTLACCVGIPAMWGIYFFLPLLHRGASKGDITWLPIASTIVLCYVLVWRVQRISGLFKQGVEVSGEILGLFIAKDRGRLEYAFEWNDNVLSSWSPVHKTKRVLTFELRQPVRVLVNPINPKQSVVRELFE